MDEEENKQANKISKSACRKWNHKHSDTDSIAQSHRLFRLEAFLSVK